MKFFSQVWMLIICISTDKQRLVNAIQWLIFEFHATRSTPLKVHFFRQLQFIDDIPLVVIPQFREIPLVVQQRCCSHCIKHLPGSIYVYTILMWSDPYRQHQLNLPIHLPCFLPIAGLFCFWITNWAADPWKCSIDTVPIRSSIQSVEEVMWSRDEWGFTRQCSRGMLVQT